MLMAGTSKRDKRQIQDEIDKLKAQVSTGGGMGMGRGRRGGGGGGGGPGSIRIDIETVRKNLPAVLELVAECLKDSTFPEKEFEKIRKQRMARIEQAMSEPMMLAMTEVRRRMVPVPPDDVRYVPTPQEQIDKLKAVKVDDVRKLYKELVGAGHAEVAVIGDFDPSEVTTLIESAFKGWKSGKPYERIAMPYFDVKPEALVINTPDKSNALIALGTNLEIRDDDPDYPALMMANYILGGNSGSRLLSRLRQKEGYSYSVNSSLSASSQDRTGAFMAFAICNPKNADNALKAALEEIKRLLKDGITQKELDDARKGYFEQVKVGLSQDGAVADMLCRQTYLGRTMKFTEEQHEKVKSLTVDQVNAAARKYLKPEKFITVRAGDLGDASAGGDEDDGPEKSKG
jgi:zinc protease